MSKSLFSALFGAKRSAVSYVLAVMLSVSVMFAMTSVISCTGADGVSGIDGRDGTDGVTPLITIGSNGNWFINGIDTGIKSTGADGLDGSDGEAPAITIGANGNWFIDGVDTGMKAAGDDGAKGDDGDKGDKGDKGDTGDKGDGCSVAADPDNSAFLVMTCGSGANITTERWAKAMCGTAAYDPADYVCRRGRVNFIDKRDGKDYRFVEIGAQIWMAENLNYRGVGSDSVGVCYLNSADSCAKYGRLYKWHEAMDISSTYESSLWGGSDVNHQGVCPVGWRVPSGQDWIDLVTAVGSTAGTKLKSQTGWNTVSGYIAGTDEYGFSALPGGFRSTDGSFYDVGDYGRWWSATENDASRARIWRMDYNGSNVPSFSNNKSSGSSVRCLQD